MKKLNVDQERCIACGACVQIDEEHFNFSPAGTSEVISQENLDSATLATAIDSCPVAAISIEGGENCDCNENCNCGDNCECGDDCKCGDDCSCKKEEMSE